MKKLFVPIFIAMLLGGGLFFYAYWMSDEMRLVRIGYDRKLVGRLMVEQPDLVQALINDGRYRENLEDYLAIEGFHYDCYDSYIEVANYYPELSLNDVVYLASFLDHVFFPTLFQQGYDYEGIVSWFSDLEFNEYIETVDLVTLNRLLTYAKATKMDLSSLLSYVDYEKENISLPLEEVVSIMDEYQTVVYPYLVEKGYATEDIESLFYQLGLSNLKMLMETSLNPTQAVALMNSSSFDASKLSIYEDILSQDESYSITYALQYAKYPNVKTNFYQDIVLTPNMDSLLVLVNQNYRLDELYVPTDFVPVDVPVTSYSQVNTNYLRRDAADATELLFAKAQEAGYELTLRTGYVSYSVQKSLYDQDVYEMGIEYADAFNSRPGHSEHQTGLAIDITTPTINNELSVEFAETEEGKWVLAHAHEFGFIIRYPEGREDEVGYSYEPYHLRYVGVEAATTIYENDWTLEDYVLNYALLDQTGDEKQEIIELPPLDSASSLEESNEEDSEEEENSSNSDEVADQLDDTLQEEVESDEDGTEEEPLESTSDDIVDEPMEPIEDKQQMIQEDSDLNTQEKYEVYIPDKFFM